MKYNKEKVLKEGFKDLRKLMEERQHEFHNGAPYQTPSGKWVVPWPVLVQIEDELYSKKRFKWRFLKEIGVWLVGLGIVIGICLTLVLYKQVIT